MNTSHKKLAAAGLPPYCILKISQQNYINQYSRILYRQSSNNHHRTYQCITQRTLQLIWHPGISSISCVVSLFFYLSVHRTGGIYIGSILLLFKRFLAVSYFSLHISSFTCVAFIVPYCIPLSLIAGSPSTDLFVTDFLHGLRSVVLLFVHLGITWSSLGFTPEENAFRITYWRAFWLRDRHIAFPLVNRPCIIPVCRIKIGVISAKEFKMDIFLSVSSRWHLTF